METALLIGLGAALVVGLYVLYLAATKGVPAAATWVKAKWGAAKKDAAALRTDLTALEQRVVALEHKQAAAPAPAPAA